MKKKTKITDQKTKPENEGSLTYPAKDDIYQRSKEETNIDPEDIQSTKIPNEDEGPIGRDEWDFNSDVPGRGTGKTSSGRKQNEKDFDDDLSGDDLDVPGSERDRNGNGDEDEENDYYSLGGDEHNDLDEDR
jgi:hypothetical protein